MEGLITREDFINCVEWFKNKGIEIESFKPVIEYLSEKPFVLQKEMLAAVEILIIIRTYYEIREAYKDIPSVESEFYYRQEVAALSFLTHVF